MKCIDLIGKTFGRLIVLNRQPNKGTNATWLCKCICGNTKTVPTARLNNGHCKSCGCLMKETVGNQFRKHGKSHTPEYRLLKDAKRRAEKFGREFNIELSDITIPDICPILGIKLEHGKKTSTDNSPSLDRINPNLGYTKNNVRIISMKANRMKQECTVAELKRLILYIEGKI
jgi:hypothetical protein